MKNNKLLFVFILILLFIFMVIPKYRIGYLDNIKLHIYHTSQLNGISYSNHRYTNDHGESINIFILNNNTNNFTYDTFREYLLTNINITKYYYTFDIKDYSFLFVSNNVYDVYLDISNSNILSIFNNKKYHGYFISTNSINSINKIDNIYYKLKIKPISLLLLLSFIIIIYLATKFYKYLFSYKINLSLKYFIIFSFSITLILFIFQYWLCFPGFFAGDSINSMLGDITNANPIIITIFLKILYNTFGYNNYYIFLLNLLLWYIGLFLLIISLYKKYNNIFFILLFLLSFLGNIFFSNINHGKDVTSSLLIWFSYSLLFFIFVYDFNNFYIKIILYCFVLLSLIIAMLWRHNMIVTIYPIFIYIVYRILCNSSLSTKKYIVIYVLIMVFVALFLVTIHLVFPRIFVNSNFLKRDNHYLDSFKDYDINHIFFLQIAACATPSNDDSFILKEWYMPGKTFQDVKDLYTKQPFGANEFSLFWIGDRIFKSHIHGVKLSWIKYILKYPKYYIKHIFSYMKQIYTVETWKISSQQLEYRKIKLEVDEDKKYLNDLFVGKSFSKNQKKIYNFIFNNLLNINISFFILFSVFLFLFSLKEILFAFCKNKKIGGLLLFSFATSFSSISTILIVGLLTPLADYRYIHPVVPITIISMISFLSFLFDNNKKES